ncbi:MAG: GAF domain-containing protein [Ignavibacteriaceae bacterium]
MADTEFLKTDIFEVHKIPAAIADKEKKIIWYSKSFKKIINQPKIKGRKFDDLFAVAKEGRLGEILPHKPVSFELPGMNYRLEVSQHSSDSSEESYFLTLVKCETENDKPENKISLAADQFQTGLKQILTELVKDRSLDKLVVDILARIVNSTSGSFALAVLINDSGKHDFYYFDPDKYLPEPEGLKREISSDFSFIGKWLSLNRRSLIAERNSDNIGFNVTNVLGTDALIFSPCLLDETLLAIVLTGKTSGKFTEFEINTVEQFSTLMAFAISHIRTTELNNTLEAKLLQAQKLETIGKLSSGMAHDFNNLLSGIFSSVNLLRNRVPKEENVTRLIDNIENCSVRAKDLTKGLLSYGKPTPKRKELIKPNMLLGEISKVITQTFPSNISFSSNIESNLYDILGNSTEIYQILLNLCVNAKEAITGKGIIKLEARNITIDEKNIINYPLLAKGNYVCFTVSDSGSGIKEEDIPKIFDPYFSTKQKDSGSGLGLYVTYGIIKAHNGYVDVKSRLNEGTTFEVYIPAFEPTRQKKSVPEEKIIMLADDEVMLRDLLAELLESNGYNVIRVQSGDEAVKILTEEIKVDLAVIDYNMPGKSGLETIGEIRKINKDVPIILSTGSLIPDYETELKKYKINDKLQKPYEFETMLATVQRLI